MDFVQGGCGRRFFCASQYRSEGFATCDNLSVDNRNLLAPILFNINSRQPPKRITHTNRLTYTKR